MRRRHFIVSTLATLFGASLNFSAFGTAAAQTKKLTGIYFDHGVLASRLPDGTWNLWVRAALRGSAPSAAVNIRLEVATDKKFQQIIAVKRLTALRKNSYAVRTNYSPKQYNSLLYFRFVWEPSAEEKNAIELDSSIRKNTSATGKLIPWSI